MFIFKVKRTIDLEADLAEWGVAKERVTMFKNLENGVSLSAPGLSVGSNMRIDVSLHFRSFFTYSVTCKSIKIYV